MNSWKNILKEIIGLNMKCYNMSESISTIKSKINKSYFMVADDILYTGIC